MKKLLLGLGTTTLAMLPVIAVASCSSTTAQPALKTEVAKLNKSFTTKDNQQKSSVVVKLINNTTSNEEKILLLKTIIEIPALNQGFTLGIKTAAVNASTPSSIDINFTILEISTEKEESGIITITGLSTAEPSTLEKEATKFTNPIKAKNSSLTTANAISLINSATSQEAKKSAVATFVDIPILDSEFSLEITSARINDKINTQVDVAMTITEKSSKPIKSVDVNLMISGLTMTAKSNLEIEAARFSTTISTTVEWLLTSGAVSQLNAQETPEGKKTELLKIAPIFEPSAGFTITIGNASINTKNPTVMDVAITVTDTALTSNNTKVATFGVKNLWQHSLQSQLNKFGTVPTTSPTTTLNGIIKAIADAPNSEEKIKVLKTIAVVPTLDAGFTLDLRGAFDSPSRKDLLVTFRIHQNSSISSETRFGRATFRVTGLKI